MKHLKTYESFKDNSELIKKLEEFGIKNYTINSDDSIDVNGYVNLHNLGLTKIPFKFGKVTGYFHCSSNQLDSLDGSPREVGGNFICYKNNLKDLIGGPQDVGGDYICHSNQLESLEGCAGDIGVCLDCQFNKLEMLDCSSVINGDIYCKANNFKEEPEFFGVCGGEIFWSSEEDSDDW